MRECDLLVGLFFSSEAASRLLPREGGDVHVQATVIQRWGSTIVLFYVSCSQSDWVEWQVFAITEVQSDDSVVVG